jgi:hypothetical protein
MCEQAHNSFELLSENNTWFQKSEVYKKFNWLL